MTEARKRYYYKNREKFIEYAKKWNKEHKDKISAYHKLKYISAKPHKIRCSVCGKFFYSKFNCKYNHNAKCLKQGVRIVHNKASREYERRNKRR